MIRSAAHIYAKSNYPAVKFIFSNAAIFLLLRDGGKNKTKEIWSVSLSFAVDVPELSGSHPGELFNFYVAFVFQAYYKAITQ